VMDSTIPSSQSYSLAQSTGAIFALIDSGVFRSTDNGMSWNLITIEPGGSYGQTIASDGSTVIVASYSGGLYRSTDDGLSWNFVSSQLDSLATVSLFLSDSIYIACAVSYVPGENSGVFVSMDSGQTWTKEEDGLQGRIFSSIVQLGNTIYGGTQWGGVYRAVISSGVSSTDNNNSGAKIFPNPSTGATELDYTISNYSFVQITIYNVLGNQVRLVSSGYLNAGPQSISLGTESLPSGNYVCRVRVGDQVNYINLAITR
jgi:photosystem II stability/assembly factor-like uncharacterized protein